MNMMQGAEAVVSRGRLLGRDVVVKERVKKKYRVSKLDTKLRTERTRAEARLLHKAKIAGVQCPVVLEVEEFRLTMSFIDGKRPKPTTQDQLNEVQWSMEWNLIPSDSKRAGEILAALHKADIIHGDFTPANLIKEGRKLFVIDFGLGFFSSDIEDKAIDVYTMLKAIDEKAGIAFLDGYKTQNPGHKTVLKRVEDVKKRVRYSQ
jgi:Kae1-associated kinase Bud32